MTGSGLPDRIVERANRVGIALDPHEAHQLAEYYELLRHWNRKINLSAMVFEGFPDRTLDRMIVEPIVIKELIDGLGPDWVDVGSGGGSPAIPLKIVRPEKTLLMVESRSRKATFLREVVRELRLERSAVWPGRIEELTRTHEAESSDLVTMRAVNPGPKVLAAIAALLKPGGRLAIFGSAPLHSIGSPFFRQLDATKLPEIRHRVTEAASNAVHWFQRVGHSEV